jgi:uncharacterized phage infection (PIP) family protein YhgE
LIVDVANDLDRTMIEELEELAKNSEENKELSELVVKLNELIEDMKEPGVDQREALAKLSEMQAAIAAAQAEFNMDVVNAQMQALGQSIAAADALAGAANALQEGDYNKAAEELESIDPASVDRKEAKTVSSELKKVAQKMSDAGLGQLSSATSEFCDGLESGESSKCKSGACKLAKLSRTYSLRKAVGECLGCQLAKLGECKGACKNGGMSKNGPQKPSNNWGRGSTGDPFGEEATRIDSTRQRQDIQGTPGEGPSEREITHAPEGRQTATREYRQNYKEFQKATEEVLRSESLPLGHRQTIRRYFEAIRPDNEAETPSDQPAAKIDGGSK